MFKIKFLAIGLCLGIIGLVLGQNERFRTFAENDAALQIAEYKKWKRMTKEPISVKVEESSLVGG